ncbi:MAG: hypothetical protein ACW97X_11535 [Candidatus Hodarchaeales archaeon]|jgi:hypothetical protein
MNQMDDLAKAFQNIHKFENYRFLRTWGIMIIIFGISAVISDTRWFLSYFINELFQIEHLQAVLFTRFLLMSIDILILLILLVLMIYTFISVKKTSITGNKVITFKNVRFGLALLALYLISPRISLFLPFPIPLSIHIPEVIGTFLAYLLMRNSLKSHQFKEILYLALIFIFLTFIEILCNVGSILLLFYSDYFILVYITYSLGINICFMICYIIVGRYSLKKANEILRSANSPD